MLARRNVAVLTTMTVKMGSCASKSWKNSWNLGMTTVIRIVISTVERTIRIAG